MEAVDDPFVCGRCKETAEQLYTTDHIPAWNPSGSNFDFLPYPVIDITRPWGREGCDACVGWCYGHYVTDIASLLALRKQGRALPSTPPSTSIEDAFKEGDATSNVDKLAKTCCLTSEEVQIWLYHLQKKKNKSRQTCQESRNPS